MSAMSTCTMTTPQSTTLLRSSPRALAIALTAVIAACTPEYTLKTSREYTQALQLTDQAEVRRSRHYVLSQRSRFYLGRIDASDDAAYIAIGKLVSDSFERHFDDVIVSPNPLPQQQARSNARANRCHYTLAVMVEYWDDEHHQWVSDEPVEEAAAIKPVTKTRGVMSSRSFKSANTKAASKTNDDQMVRVKMTVRDAVTDQLVDAIEMKSKPGYLQGIDEEAMKMLEPALRDLTASLAGDADD
jgi:hypothetical protein